MRVLLFCIAILPVSGWSQDRPYKPVLADLFRRAQSSELIAIVTVAERRRVRTQISDEELFRLGDMNKGYGGSLYTLKVEEVLCAKTDFDLKARKARLKPDKILVFKDQIDGEYYQLGRRYLVFFTPHREQKDLATKYRLQPRTTYYEAFDGERGLISLAGEEPAPVAKMRQFCRALRPADPDVKIRSLNRLLGSGESDLDQAAAQAIEFFRRELSRSKK